MNEISEGILNNFEKISQERYIMDVEEEFGTQDIDFVKSEYKEIKIPKRATSKSAGYDFFAPFSFVLEKGQEIKIPTGIKCQISDGQFLAILPRSSMGFKYGLKLVNTMGIIDGDYYNNTSNEGHIFIKITTEKHIVIHKGDAFAQGIFMPYFITKDDNVTNLRSGGLGSTDK